MVVFVRKMLVDAVISLPTGKLILLTVLLLALAAIPSAATSDERQASSGNFDGPAELPRKHVKTALVETPAPGKVYQVKEGQDLQQAINNAKCGDTLELQAGATFQGIFHFPNKPCDDAHWIVVRTSAPDTSLPPENTILTPCYAGVPSLPGRPDFHCSDVHNVLAKLELDRKAEAGPVL